MKDRGRKRGGVGGAAGVRGGVGSSQREVTGEKQVAIFQNNKNAHFAQARPHPSDLHSHRPAHYSSVPTAFHSQSLDREIHGLPLLTGEMEGKLSGVIIRRGTFRGRVRTPVRLKGCRTLWRSRNDREFAGGRGCCR